MIVQHSGDRVVLQAPAKLNLHLEALAKRPDGYHELETLMVTVGLCDTLEISAAPTGTEFVCNDPALAGADNLAVQAVERVRRETGRQDGVKLVLSKRIPVAAGLAGGSSDAAAALIGLSAWWSLGWDRPRLAALGAELGSDVPFFFQTPAAVCRGRGEKVVAAPLGKPLHFVVVKPPRGLGTAAVFGRLAPPAAPRKVEPILAALAAGEPAGIAALLFNRLEEPALGIAPEIAACKAALTDCGAMGSLMTGSGSASFGLCRDAADAQAVAGRLAGKGLGQVFVANSHL
jgi:4-diphosphocytidyl-2-C-methyl-D-erythritol kinase